MKDFTDLLGRQASDKITGFKGVITSISFDISGCIQAWVSPKTDGKKEADGVWFDVARLIVAKTKKVMEPSFLAYEDAAKVHGPERKAPPSHG